MTVNGTFVSLSIVLLLNAGVCVLLRDAGHPAASHSVPTIPLSVSSRLEEDSVPNYMLCHMQPELHQYPVPHQTLIGRSWMPTSDDDVVARNVKAQPSVATVNGKTSPDSELSNSVDTQAPVGVSHADKEDNGTQTG